MRSALGLFFVLLVVAPAAVHAKPEKARATQRAAAAVQSKREVRFLGLDPHGPLAVVRRGKLDAPDGGACRSWAPRGSRWRSLDTIGRVVGEVEVVGMERYDVTNCDELVLKTRAGEAGSGVFVSTGYEPVAIEAWKIPEGARAKLDALVRRRDATLPPVAFGEKPDLALRDRLLAFRTPGGEELAVVGGRGLTVLRLDKDGWKVLHAITPKKGEVGHPDMFRPLSALDMNRDGRVEIVIHERDVDAYADFTLTPSGKGYRVVDAGIHGAFA